MTSLNLIIDSEQLSAPAVQDLTRALQGDIRRHTDATADVPETQAEAHQKGEAITLGVLAVTFMTSGAAVAVLNVLKAYLERDSRISIIVEKPDGTKTTLSAANLDDAQLMAATLHDNAAT